MTCERENRLATYVLPKSSIRTKNKSYNENPNESF